MTESQDGPADMRWAHRLEQLDREIARMALLCVLERVLRNDPSVCETPKPHCVCKVARPAHGAPRALKQSAETLDEAQKAQIEAHIIERLRKLFPAIAHEWPHAS